MTFDEYERDISEKNCTAIHLQANWDNDEQRPLVGCEESEVSL